MHILTYVAINPKHQVHIHTQLSYAFYTMEPYLCLLNIPLQMWSLFREGFLLDCRMTKLAFSATQELASSGIEVQ